MPTKSLIGLFATNIIFLSLLINKLIKLLKSSSSNCLKNSYTVSNNNFAFTL